MTQQRPTSPSRNSPAGSDGPGPAWHWLGNVPVTQVTFARAVDLIAGWARRAPFRLVVTPNVDHIMHLQRNEDFRAAYARADLSLVDGRPVQWAARCLGLPPLEKVSGSDLTPALCRRGMAARWRIYFVGGHSAEELEECLRRIGERYPGLVIDGWSPPFGFERDEAECAALVNRIRTFAPDLLFFGCGAPKSEIWMARHADALGGGVGIGCGAGLRFLAGMERRAPRWMQRVGLEWLWRLGRDPLRLWRRYLVDDMFFFPLVWRWKRELDRSRKAQDGTDH